MRGLRGIVVGSVALLVAGGAVAAAVLDPVVVRPVGTASGEPRVTVLPEPDALPAASFGDPATVDPCGLLDVATFERFGPTLPVPSYGRFNQCNTVTAVGRTSGFGVSATLVNPQTYLPSRADRRDGGIEVSAFADEDGGCERLIEFQDAYQVLVRVEADDPGIDRCAMADLAVETAVARLLAGPLPTRSAPADPASLLGADACALVDAEALLGVPALDLSRGTSPEFGNWGCDWGYPADNSSAPSALIFFFRDTAPDGDREDIAGRAAVVFPNADDEYPYCQIALLHREIDMGLDETGYEIVYLSVTVDDLSTSERACAEARELAATIVPNLP